MDQSVGNTLVFVQCVVVTNQKTVPFYGSVSEADNFFALMLEGQRWAYIDNNRKLLALISATRRIENLSFVGHKNDPNQFLQFPRGTDTKVPVQIEQATYQLALALLKGIDPNTEADNLSMTLQSYSGLRTEYDRTWAPHYFRAGIPSQDAWNLLLPFLQEQRGITLARV